MEHPPARRDLPEVQVTVDTDRLARGPRRLAWIFLLLIALPLALLLGAAAEAIRRSDRGDQARAAATREHASETADALRDALVSRLDERLAGIEREPLDRRLALTSADGELLLLPSVGTPEPLIGPALDDGSALAPIDEVLRRPADQRVEALTELLADERLPERARLIGRFRLAVLQLRLERARRAGLILEELLPDVAGRRDAAGMPLELTVRRYLAEAYRAAGDPFRAARQLIALERDLGRERWGLLPGVRDYHRRAVARRLSELLASDALTAEDRRYVEARRATTAALRWQVAWVREAAGLTVDAGPRWRGRRWQPPDVDDAPADVDGPQWLFARRTRGGALALQLVAEAELDRWIAPVLEREGAARRARFALADEATHSLPLTPLLDGRALTVDAWGLVADADAARRRVQLLWLLLAVAALVIGAGLVTGYRFLAREVEAARAKQVFLASISHELRTPLTSIRLFAESLSDGGLPEDKVLQYAGRIDREAHRLTRLIEGVLDLAALDRGQVRLRIEPRSVRATLSEAAELFQHKASRDRCVLDVHLPVEDFAVLADREALVQVLIALLDNAAKYGPTGGSVRLQATADGDVAELSVSDHGPGIPRSEREHVLRRFHRGRATGGAPGLGLGLSIAETLVRAMDGELQIRDNERLGTHGAHVVVRLPLSSQPALLPAGDPA